MKKLKVIQLIDSLDIGGAEMLAVNITNLLRNTSVVDSYICATRKEGGLKDKVNEDSYLFLGKKSSFDLKAIFILKKYIVQNEIQIIHAHSTSYFIAFCIKLLLGNKIKIVWHDHYGNSDLLNERKKEPLQFISNFFSSIIVVNTNLLKWAQDNLKCKEISFLNNFGYFNDENKITYLNGVEGKRIVILAAFRLQKNHLNLLNAFIKVYSSYPEWTLHIIGKGNGDAYEKSLHDFVSEKKLNKNIFFYGACNDIKHILSQATIGVLSSDSEGLPISLLEYGLAKLPVVVTDVGECNKVVENNVTGFVVEKNNAFELSKHIELLIDSKKTRLNFGNKLQKTIEKKYSKDNFISQLIKIYTEIL